MSHTQHEEPVLGLWRAGAHAPKHGEAALRAAIDQVQQAFCLVDTPEGYGVGIEGEISLGTSRNGLNAGGAHAIRAFSPPSPPSQLGDPGFRADHGLKFPYIAGAMANGIGSAEIVEAMARGGMIGFFGAAGLGPVRVEAAIDRVQKNLRTDAGSLPYGFNLIHSPNEPDLEAATVDLYLRRGVKTVSASAYLGLTKHVVRYRVHGIHRDSTGRIVTPNHILAKVSRIEVAQKFFSPPPEEILKALVDSKEITAEQAELAAQIPMAQDLTAEADSGGHTDNQPFVTLLPTMLALRDEMQAKYNFEQKLRVGAAGGIGTPAAAAAAFAMGAAYVLTGSVNQACVEAGTSDLVRGMLAQTRQADVAMCPAADMFEMGVRVQVLKRGTMFPMRAAKLYEVFKAYGSIEEIPAEPKSQLEKTVFRAPLEDIWRQTHEFFQTRDPRQNERAARDPKHKMALVFRWYLGQASRWANSGEASRQIDYQIWCGPAMGAFNEWVKGSFLEEAKERNVVTVAENLLVGAATLARVQGLRSQGIALGPEFGRFAPQRPEALKERLH